MSAITCKETRHAEGRVEIVFYSPGYNDAVPIMRSIVGKACHGGKWCVHSGKAGSPETSLRTSLKREAVGAARADAEDQHRMVLKHFPPA